MGKEEVEHVAGPAIADLSGSPGTALSSTSDHFLPHSGPGTVKVAGSRIDDMITRKVSSSTGARRVRPEVG
ncbi:MAG: hypothetical protein IPF92_21745 [Myxococcales bacterium]|nr:hypothetical protein [Myxococcales bacterium]